MFKKIMMAGLASAAMMYAPGAIANDYVVISNTAAVNVDADTAWSRIGDYCLIAELLDISCRYSAGTGDLGTIRSLADDTVVEPMVAQTARSYTYSQLAGSNAGLDYHGTLAVEPAGPNQATIHYTLVYDQTRLPDDATRSELQQALQTRFQGAVSKAKALAEGG